MNIVHLPTAEQLGDSIAILFKARKHLRRMNIQDPQNTSLFTQVVFYTTEAIHRIERKDKNKTLTVSYFHAYKTLIDALDNMRPLDNPMPDTGDERIMLVRDLATTAFSNAIDTIVNA